MSFTASKPSGYRLVMCSKTILDTCVSSLALDGPCGQARDDTPLEQQHAQLANEAEHLARQKQLLVEKQQAIEQEQKELAMTREQWEQLHCRHSELHLGFLMPVD